MSEPFLICHVVRGEPAFDIAEQIPCPVCEPIRQGLDVSSPGCKECDFEGFWWIIPTSGHRARPYWFVLLTDIDDTYDLTIKDHTFTIDATREIIGEMSGPSFPPAGWPDHYPVNQPRSALASAQSGADLLEELGL